MKKINKLFFSQKSIESVTTENNIFDLYEEQLGDSILFEVLNGKIETCYPSIMSNLKECFKVK
jgi:hypothetical protein